MLRELHHAQLRTIYACQHNPASFKASRSRNIHNKQPCLNAESKRLTERPNSSTAKVVRLPIKDGRKNMKEHGGGATYIVGVAGKATLQ